MKTRIRSTSLALGFLTVSSLAPAGQARPTALTQTSQIRAADPAPLAEAQQLIRDGKYDAALAALTPLADKSKDDFQYHSLVGMAYRGKFTDANGRKDDAAAIAAAQKGRAIFGRALGLIDSVQASADVKAAASKNLTTWRQQMEDYLHQHNAPLDPPTDVPPPAGNNTPPPATGATPTFAKGDKVQVLWNDKWYPAVVLEAADGSYKIHYDEYGDNWDETVGPARIRKPVAETAPSDAAPADAPKTPDPTAKAPDTPSTPTAPKSSGLRLPSLPDVTAIPGVKTPSLPGVRVPQLPALPIPDVLAGSVPQPQLPDVSDLRLPRLKNNGGGNQSAPPSQFYTTYAYVSDRSVTPGADAKTADAPTVSGTLTLKPTGEYEKHLTVGGGGNGTQSNEAGTFRLDGNKITFTHPNPQGQPETYGGTFRFELKSLSLGLVFDRGVQGKREVFGLGAKGTESVQRRFDDNGGVTVGR